MNRLQGCFAVALAVASCHSGSAVATYPDAPVIIVSIDTLRADHLPLYGYKAGSTPRLDAFGGEAVVFEDEYSHCPLTLPSHASLLTGLLPPHHGVRDNIGFRLKEGPMTLPARFKAAGFETGGAVSAYILRSQTGIARGFDFYDDAFEIDAGSESLSSLQRDGAQSVEALGRWIDGRHGRFFAFLHLYEPHWPYTPPAQYQSLKLPYDGEVAYADELVGRLFDRLKARGLYDRAIIAVTSDHGEGLNDHGEQEHGVFLYREALHVPLILRLPHGLRGGTRVKGTVAEVDLPATLLDLAGLSIPGIDGRSLRSAIDTGASSGERVYSETFYARYHFGWSELFSATEPRYHYIRAPRPELFDLDRDPTERANLMEAHAALAAPMNAWLTSQTEAKAQAPDEPSAEAKERLRALGYVGVSTVAAGPGPLPDPKDKIAGYEDFKRALTLRDQGKSAEAVDTLRRVLKDNPRMLDAWETLGLTLVKMDRIREGAAALEKALDIDPLHPQIHITLARLYGLEGQREKAESHALLAAERDPAGGYELSAQLMLDRNDSARAAAYAAKSLSADGRRVMSHFVVGVVAQRSGRYEEALAAFRAARDAQQFQKNLVVRDLHANMADCLARLGREAEAEQEFLAEIGILPASREARTGLAMLYRSQGKDGAARDALGGLIAAQPHATAEDYWVVVKTFSVLGDTVAAREWAAKARARFPADSRFR